MDKNDVLELWQQPDPQLQQLAVSMAVALLPDSFDTCLAMLGQASEAQAAQLVIQLRANLPFLRAGFSLNYDTTQAEFQTYSGLAARHRSLLAALARRKDPLEARRCYTFFDGLRPDLQHLFPDTDFTDCLRPEEQQAPGGHQLMVFVTGMCNLHCSYCFSSDIERQHISAHDLQRIFSWAAANACSVVTPCGGEPLMYPHMGLFLDLVARHNMRTYFASNCTFPLQAFTRQQLGCIDLITFHITESLWHRPDYMRTFCQNIELARQHGIDIIARANIVRPDMDVSRWFEIIDRYGLKKMNIALTIPSGAHDNRYTDTRLFASFVPVVQECIAQCEQRRVSISFAKPIPPCVFDDATAARLLRYENFMPTCNVHEDGGTRNVCLSPDMQFTPCLGVPRPQIPFSEDLTWQQLQQQLGSEVGCALLKPLSDRCKQCFLYARRLCQGACLSYKYLAP